MDLTLKPVLSCSMGCTGCLPADTLILMADGSQKPIQEVTVGDTVWSYKISGQAVVKIECGQVVEIYQHKVAELVELSFNQHAVTHFRLTDEHPVWTQRGWVPAGQIVVGDKILRVWHSRTAAALANTDWQATGVKIRATRLARGLNRPFANSPEQRERKRQTMRANNPMRDPDVARRVAETMRGQKRKFGNSPANREAARQRMLTNNPMFDAARVKHVLAKGNQTRAAKGRICKGQLKLAEIVRSLGLDCELEYSVGRRFIDVAIPSLKKGLEYDAWWGHFTERGRTLDAIRDAELAAKGWTLLHIGPNEPYYPEMIPKVQAFLDAHHNSRQLIRVRKIKRIAGDVEVYNFAVRPNENYVADGILVHNCYESQIFRENGNQPEPYDLDAINATLTKYAGSGRAGLHGGEVLLMPLPDLDKLMQMSVESGKSLSIQTGLGLLNDGHIDLFKRHKLGVGVSLNGPDLLNRDRLAVPHTSRSLPVLDVNDATDKMTERIHRNIERLVEAGISVSIICVLSKTNAGDAAKLKRLIAWANDLGERLGIWSIRFNPLHDDMSGGNIELSEQEATAAYLRLCKETLGDARRMWLPFREYVDNIWGLGCQPCWHGGCDVYQTSAVHAVFGDGSEGNCLRPAKDGVAYLRDTQTIDMRGAILKQTPYEDGGCKDCRHWRVCKGACPAEGIDGDWRNRSRFCQIYYQTYSYLVELHKSILPSFTPVQEWSTNDEAGMLQAISNRQPPISPIHPMLKEWSQTPSSWRQDARVQR